LERFWDAITYNLHERQPLIADPLAGRDIQVGDRTYYITDRNWQAGVGSEIVGNLYHRSPIGTIVENVGQLVYNPRRKVVDEVKGGYNTLTNIHRLPETWEVLPDYKKQDIVVNLAAGLAIGAPQSVGTQATLARSGDGLARIAPRTYRELPIVNNEPFYPNFPRLPQDIAANPTRPVTLDLNRPIGRSPAQNSALQRDILSAKKMEAYDFLVNQQQTNAAGIRVGANRPDLQFNLKNGQRVYVEYDTPGSSRGLPHLYRIQANDPIGKVILKTVPSGD
jgi:hypothetical protein